MKKLRTVFMATLAIFVMIAAGAFAGQQQADPPRNVIQIEIILDPVTGSISFGGFSQENSKWFGIPNVDMNKLSFMKNVDSAHLRITNEEISFKVNGQMVFMLTWDEESRTSALDLASKYLDDYGISLTDAQKSSIEKYAGSTTFDIKFNTSGELSAPFNFQFDTDFYVDVSEEGLVSIENFPLIWLDNVVKDIYRTGEVESALVCLNEGKITSQINGNRMPDIKVYKEGFLGLLNNVLEVGIENDTPFFLAKLGVNLALDGADYEGADCSE